MTKNVIAVLDFGSQYSHLIVRRIWELGVYAKLLPPETPASALQEYAGVILSGGPQNLSKPGALKADPRIYTLGLPILGVCYGLQLIAHQLGGKVRAGKKREYGPVHTSLATSSALFKNLSRSELTWMSHGDQVVKAPRGFKVMGTSEACGVAAMEHHKRRIYGIQFHPEVRHTEHGIQVLQNFLNIVGVKKSWRLGKDWIESAVLDIK